MTAVILDLSTLQLSKSYHSAVTAKIFNSDTSQLSRTQSRKVVIYSPLLSCEYVILNSDTVLSTNVWRRNLSAYDIKDGAAINHNFHNMHIGNSSYLLGLMPSLNNVSELMIQFISARRSIKRAKTLPLNFIQAIYTKPANKPIVIINRTNKTIHEQLCHEQDRIETLYLPETQHMHYIKGL